MDVVTLPLDFGDDAQPQPSAARNHPRLIVRLHLDRPGGWLAGGPTGVIAATRDPRLRAPPRSTCRSTSSTARRAAGLVLHDAAVFGLARARWTIDLSDDPASGLAAHLTQEDRVLLGELAAALGARPTTGAMAGLIDALVALGLGTLQADGRLAFEVDPVERLLLDARSVLPRLFAEERAALATAIAATTGGSSVAAVATVPLGTTASVAARPRRSTRRVGLRDRSRPWPVERVSAARQR